MVDRIGTPVAASEDNPIGKTPEAPEGADFERFLDAILDPDGAKVTVGAASEGGDLLGVPFGAGEVSIEFEYNGQDGASLKGNAEVTPGGTLLDGENSFGGGGKFGIPGVDDKNGGTVQVSLYGMEATRTTRYSEDGARHVTYEISLPDQLTKSMPDRGNKFLDELPDGVKDAWRGPAGLVAEIDAKAVLTEETSPDGVITAYGGVKLEASPSDTLTLGGVVDLDKFKAFAQVDGVFKGDEFDGVFLPADEEIAAFEPAPPLDMYGTFNPETNPGYVGTVELSPRQSIMVTADGRRVAGMETVRPETALALQTMVREVTIADYEAKAQNADTAAKRIENEAVAGALRGGASIREAQNLGVDVRAVQSYHGDTRNADALIADSRDNGSIDGSNLPEAKVGDQTYAVSVGGGLMHGRTTMTPGEIAARASARAAYGGDVDADAVAKAQADAMAQSLREGFSVKQQVATSDPIASLPGEASAAVRQQLEAMIDDKNGAALAGQERKALEGMIAEARKIEEAVKFEGAKGLADNEYAVAMQMQERRALGSMIAEAQKLDALADVPIPEFKPDIASSRQTDGPDMRGEAVAYGRGTIENGPNGKNVAYDSFNDWANDVRDMFSGNGPKEGVATPNAAEVEQEEPEKKDAAHKHEGGENRGQQNDIPEAGSKQNDDATSAEFHAMGGSSAGSDKDDKADAKEIAQKKNTSQKHEGGESRGQQGPTENERSEFGGSASDFSGSGGLL
jgi:hypothetical protein